MPFTPGDGFGFGLETEYILVDAHSFRPLWYRDLSFARLHDALADIPLGDFGAMKGLEPLPPHRFSTPYLIEGYHVYDEAGKARDLLAKGLEIRTPKAHTIEETLLHHVELYERMQTALLPLGYQAVALSHHPMETSFEGEQGPRSSAYWPWAKTAMMTYGPDINISLPRELADSLDLGELVTKVNYYAPALTALSVASPLFQGRLWEIDGRRGKAIRTFRRARVGQSLELHPEQAGRIEFKPMEMSTRVADFHAYLLLWLTLLLDDALLGRASHEEHVHALELAAREGVEPLVLRATAMEVIESAMATLPGWGFDVAPLDALGARVEAGRAPADEIIELFEEYGNVPDVLRHLCRLVPEAGLELKQNAYAAIASR